MNGLQQLETTPSSTPAIAGYAPSRGRIVAQALIGLALVTLIPTFVVEDPRAGWVTVLIGALVLMDAALATGLRQWVRDHQDRG